MEAKFSEFVAYFEDLARKHVDIKHTDGEPHFYRFELDEYLTGTMGEVNYPAMILEGYDIGYQDSQSDNVLKSRDGGFMLIGKVDDSKDFKAIHELWDKLEAIGDDILIKMMSDKRSNQVKVVRDFDISDARGMLMPQGEIGEYGMRFTFRLASSKSNEVNPDRWL